MAASRIRPCAVPRRLYRRGRNRTVATLSSSFRIARHLLAATVDPSVYKDAAVVLATAGVIVPGMAPIGGSLAIFGWLVLVVSAVVEAHSK